MAKRVKTRTVEIVGDEEEEVGKDAEADVDDRAMEDIAKDFAEGERLVKLYRYPGDLGGRPRFLAGLAPQDFNEVLILERFGGGRYFGRYRKKNGQYTRYSFDIEGEPKVFTRAEEARRFEEDGGGEPYPYLNQSREPEESQSSRIGMIDVLKMMAETRKEAREEMRVMLEMMRPAQNAPDATEKVFSLVEKLAPLISQGGGEGGGNGNPWLFAITQLKEPLSKFLDTVHTAITKGAAQPAQGSVMRPSQPDLRPQVVNNPQPAPVEPVTDSAPLAPQPIEGDMIAESFKEYLPMLVKAAAEKKGPDLYCDLILDQVPGFMYDRLRAWLLKPGCLDALAKHAPIISADPNQRLWWDALRRLLIEALNEELGDAPTPLQSEPDSNPSAASPADSDRVS